MFGQYVGIDLHRRRSMIVHKDQAGAVLSVRRIDNDPLNLAAAIADAGESPEVILEATYGWYWTADLLDELGCRVHLASPSSLIRYVPMHRTQPPRRRPEESSGIAHASPGSSTERTVAPGEPRGDAACPRALVVARVATTESSRAPQHEMR